MSSLKKNTDIRVGVNLTSLMPGLGGGVMPLALYLLEGLLSETNFSFTYFVNESIKEPLVFLNELKAILKNEKGIKLRIATCLLEDSKLLIVPDGKLTAFHHALAVWADWDIASYQAFNDSYKHTEVDKKARKKVLNEFADKLSPILENYPIS